MRRLSRSAAGLPRVEGFTLLELLVVLLVIGVLAAMLMESYKSFAVRAERLRCTANLRSLHVSLAAYTHDHLHWPQCPSLPGDADYDAWWLKEMSAYNLGRSNWECPTLKGLQDRGEATKPKALTLHYTPTPFDDGERTPYKWPLMPWAVEIGDFHGDGNLILFQDGAVKGFNQFSAQNP